MSWFNLNYILQSNFLLIFLIGIYHFLLKKDTNFNFNRTFLILIGFIALIVPLIDVPIVNKTLVSLPNLDLGSADIAVDAISSSVISNEASFWEIISFSLPYLYLSLVVFMLLLLVIKLIKITNKVNRIKNSSQFNYRNFIYVSEENIEPFTYFKASFISQSMLNKRGSQLIINHERTHARENHSIDIVIAEFFNCLFFLNPFKSIYLKYVAENHEYLADAKVTQEKINEDYTSLLINLTLKREGLHIVSFFAKPSILNRIDMMKRTKKSRINQVVASLCALLLVSMFACDFQEEEIVLQEVPSVDSNTLSEEDLNNKVFTIVENQAEPVNGIQGFYDNIADYMDGQYPAQAKNMGIEGVVFIQFVIEKDGSLSNIQPVKGIGAGCDELAVKAVESVGSWRAGMQNGKVVRSQRIVPIRFTLESSFL